MEEKRKICVLEPKAARSLFGGEDPLGKALTAEIRGTRFDLEVVGVMEKRSEKRLSTNELGFRYKTKKKLVSRMMNLMGLMASQTEWKRTETGVHIPIGLMPGQGYRWMIVKTEPTQASEVAKELHAFLLERGKNSKAYANLFLPVILEKRLKTEYQLKRAVFVICLVMGGVMIMNIMLLSVVERYREIAIRRVEGATKGDILIQFITEGAVLCIIATILGIPLGVLLAYFAAKAEPYALAGVAVPFKEIPLCVAWSVGIGIISAILPARKAAGLDPVEVLRNE